MRPSTLAHLLIRGDCSLQRKSEFEWIQLFRGEKKRRSLSRDIRDSNSCQITAERKNMAAISLTPLQQMMANGDLNMSDLANLSSISSQQQNNDYENNAATPGYVDETAFQETQTIDSAITENNNPADQYDGEEMYSTEFNKELFLEEVRKYRCLWDISSEVYKSRPMKQNAWSKIGQLFNKYGEFQLVVFLCQHNETDILAKNENFLNNLSKSMPFITNLKFGSVLEFS